MDTLQERVSLEFIENGALELVSSQKYGVGLKQLHNESIVRGLNWTRMLRYFNGYTFMHRVNCRIRGMLLNRLASDTEKIKAEISRQT